MNIGIVPSTHHSKYIHTRKRESKINQIIKIYVLLILSYCSVWIRLKNDESQKFGNAFYYFLSIIEHWEENNIEEYNMIINFYEIPIYKSNLRTKIYILYIFS